MEYIEEISTQDRASDEIIRSDGTIYTFDHRTIEDENGAIQHICKGYLITPEELNGIHNGILPSKFQLDDFLHTIFRTYQHQRADNEYVYAQRMFRAYEDTIWETYISQLDEWNNQISGLASTFSTTIPEMPARPSGF